MYSCCNKVDNCSALKAGGRIPYIAQVWWLQSISVLPHGGGISGNSLDVHLKFERCYLNEIIVSRYPSLYCMGSISDVQVISIINANS